MSSGKIHEDLCVPLAHRNVYRPRRFAVHEIFGPHRAEVEMGGDLHPVVNLSMNGLAINVSAEKARDLPPGTQVPIRVVVLNRCFYEGSALVARAEGTGKGCRMGLHLANGFLDLARIGSALEEMDL